MKVVDADKDFTPEGEAGRSACSSASGSGRQEQRTARRWGIFQAAAVRRALFDRSLRSESTRTAACRALEEDAQRRAVRCSLTARERDALEHALLPASPWREILVQPSTTFMLVGVGCVA